MEAKESFGHGVENKLVWVDLESTGLDPDRDVILEVAVVVTDWNLLELDHQTYVVLPERELPPLSPFIVEMHGKNGLLSELWSGVSIAAIDEWLALMVGPYGGPIAGSTPSFDRQFIRRHMPKLNACFDHRCFDVSTLKQCARMWGGGWPKDGPGHRALADVRGSIEECRKLRNRFWVDRQILPAPTIQEVVKALSESNLREVHGVAIEKVPSINIETVEIDCVARTSKRYSKDEDIPF